MSRGAVVAIGHELDRLGFRLSSIQSISRRVPGAYRNEGWFKVRMECPCGREKTLWLKHASVPDLRDHLRQHLVEDGLLAG